MRANYEFLFLNMLSVFEIFIELFENYYVYGILYNQFLIDRDSCSDIVGYFYDAAPGQIYKNWQGELTQLLIYSPG